MLYSMYIYIRNAKNILRAELILEKGLIRVGHVPRAAVSLLKYRDARIHLLTPEFAASERKNARGIYFSKIADGPFRPRMRAPKYRALSKFIY